MKAIQFTRYGSPDVLELREVEKPTPKGHQVLIKVYAASVNALDWRRIRANPALVRLDGGLLKPKSTSLGNDIAGRVEAVGEAVTQFKPGDEVYGVCTTSFAEYALAAEKYLALKPTRLSFEQAAAVPVAALTALQGLRNRGQIQPGQKMLINGAGGGVGTFTVQIAKAFGAEVTAVCSTRNLDMARSIGADHVIDYTKEDFTRNGQRYDWIVAVNGYRSLFAYLRSLAPHGTCIVLGGSMALLLQTLVLGRLVAKLSTKKISFVLSHASQPDLVYLSELIDAGKVSPVIDRCYPLAATADAIRYVEAGHTSGKVVITVAHD